MKLSQQCKAVGLKDPAEFAELIGENRRKLYDWYKHKPNLFYAALLGAVEIKKRLGGEV